MDLGIPPLRIKDRTESKPSSSRFLVGGLAIGGRARTPRAGGAGDDGDPLPLCREGSKALKPPKNKYRILN